MTSDVPEHLLRTQQHRRPRDLSDDLVHMTTSPAALASIITSGHIEAREPFGLGRTLKLVGDKHKAACFTEMPLSELDRLRDRNRSWGIAFKREFVLKQGGQRVWYLDADKTPYRAIYGLKEIAYDNRDWTNPVWELMPFIEE